MMMAETVSAGSGTVIMSSVMKASASAEVVVRVRSSKTVVQVACTALKGKSLKYAKCALGGRSGKYLKVDCIP